MLFRMTLLLVLALALFACSDSGREPASTNGKPTVAPQVPLGPNPAEQALERVASVLSGYRAFSGRLPAHLSDLDSGDYMFDSAYLAEILPEDTELYLALGSEADATRMWLLSSGEAPALSRSLAAMQPQSVDAAALAQLKGRWQVVARAGRVTEVRF